MYEAFKMSLDCCVDLIIIVTFIFGFETLKYKCSETTRNLYIGNCLKVQKVLDNIIKTGNATADDINNIAIANQDASLYLDKDTINFTKNLWQLIAQYHILNKRNDVDKQKIVQLIKELDEYKSDKVISHYRKRIIGW